MKQSEIKAMLALEPSYKQAAKEEFRRLSRKLLTNVVKELGLAKGSYDLRYNPGGVAVSGDATLHTNTLYISFNLDGRKWVLVRTCKGRKDYHGGLNQSYDFERLERDGLPAFIDWLKTNPLIEVTSTP